MMKQLSLALTLVFAVACKTDAPAPSSADPAASEGTGKARSAKIAVKPVAPATTDTPAAGSADRPGLDPAARQAWRERREAKLDRDGDGKISEEERSAAMRDRVVNMRARLDADGDGKLTPAELAGGRMKLDDPAALDTNHDGDISADELAVGMKARREQRRLERGSAATPGPTAP